MSNIDTKMPKGIGYIIGNEAAERFSFYGMKAILIVFMTKYLMDSSGDPSYMNENQAKEWYHLFVGAVYFFPIIGAIVADIWWGKYKTIMSLSVVYCLGHLTLALFETKMGLAAGLTLIAIGSGGIKPCVSAHLGDQFTSKNKSLIDKVFGNFYFAINFGAFFSTLLTPILLQKYGPSVAFGIPGLLMFLATVVFWMGRDKFIAIEAVGWKKYKEDVFSPKGLKAMMGLGTIYFFIAFFWALYDQTGSAWILQAKRLNLHVDLRFSFLQFDFLSFDILPSQIQAVNPIMVMGLIPLFTFVIYPYVRRFVKLTALRKIGAGFFVAAISFSVIAWVEHLIQLGQTPSVLWHVLAFLILTIAEILISITALEFSYTQAPKSMKSIIMGLFLLSSSIGNFITALVNRLIQNEDGTNSLSGASYYWFFVGLILVAGTIYSFIAKYYKEESYIYD